MASTQEYKDFVLEQFDKAPVLSRHISCRAMMGEFVLYYDGVVFGGIYDDRLLVKKVPELSAFGMAKAIPYDGGKVMYLVECVDEPEKLREIVRAVVDGLKK